VRARAVAPSGRTARGRRAERLAGEALAAIGFRVVDRNVYVGGGEIDLIAWEGDVLCFIEVRARTSTRYGSPVETVTPDKRRHLSRAAAAWLAKSVGPWPRCRFDLVAVVGPEGAEELALHRAVFEVTS
jgi:putative endonuclease